ncbi:cysteine proteinase [Pholiota conissans]|uniref:Ubiquitin carboxyl-terminal hydrolase n=1 Tax=Pholiota conissans TaxID=109636 RepID=A0A9P5Z9B0_9AGAR|nr:cysteine proteinase [Pholiota conissans]
MANGTSTCPHISYALNDKNLGDVIRKKYTSVVSWSAYRSNVLRPTKRRKIAAPTCGTCSAPLSRPIACLQCPYTGCWNDRHAAIHLRDTGHSFCADTKTGYLFCAGCDDFIYDVKLDELHLAAIVSAEEKQTKFRVSKKPRETYKPWVPSPRESTALEGAEPIPCQGRRGLLNLGQTCFLNVVLQCFIHNPLLRNYFLSDKHNCKQCKIENCTSCEMDKLFTEIYSDDTTPYGPITFLATTWKASAELSGYAQQDAHEFFMSTLNQIHQTSRGSTNISCNCIIHSTFDGQLQSDVKCERCGNVTTTVDPMLDVSLELKGKGGEVASAENTLGACLRRFTQPEKLNPKEYSCGKCGKAAHEASKRLSIRKLPPVLSFQFKRFEHKTNDKSAARKIDAAIRFPASINMAPYTTLAMKDSGVAHNGANLAYPGPESMYEYDLFAVINHEGQIDNGHYTNFARFQDEWYRFDDDKVTASSLGACLNSAAYMCFYVKRHLDYKPNMTPSYVLARENEALREKELEKEKEAARMRELEDDLLSTL